jgi:uncharacterized membrane protein YeiB
LQLLEQFTSLALDLGGMLQGVWQFDALVTFAAIGWAVTTAQSPRPPSVLARVLLALGLAAFYALNVYVLWNLLERFRATQALARHYAELAVESGHPALLDTVYQDLPDYVLHGSAGIGAATVIIVLLIMSRPARAPGQAA